MGQVSSWRGYGVNAGLGDAFAGGFIAELIKGGSLESCVKAGQYVASQVIKVSGAVYPTTAPTFEFKSKLTN
jgi:sugar/nucleoside kinase (ribokinase family)